MQARLSLFVSKSNIFRNQTSRPNYDVTDNCVDKIIADTPIFEVLLQFYVV